MPAPPNSGGVLAAVRRLQPHISPTPLYRSDSLSRGFDADVWLKVETASPIASFKLRGALNTLLINREFGEIRTAVTSSTGNHGQGVAYAARLLNSPVRRTAASGRPRHRRGEGPRPPFLRAERRHLRR